MATRITGEDRDTLYTLTGATTETTIVTPGDSGSGFGNISSIFSDTGGNIVLQVQNTAGNETNFSYISAIQIIPEPATTPALIGLTALGFVFARRRR